MARLEVEGVDVRFGGVRALSGVSLTVEPARVTGLIGPNGAGKTTLFNVVCGLQRPSAGDVRLDGRSLARVPAHRRARCGLGRTFQRLEVFGSLTVRENLLVAAEIRRRWARDRADPRRGADDVLDLVGLGDVADRRADELPTGLARLVEVGRALVTKPSVLLLDEPSSGLDEAETDALAALLARVAGGGVAVLLVEHDVDLVMTVCAWVWVLNFGELLAGGAPAAIREDPAVQSAYLGRPQAVTAS